MISQIKHSKPLRPIEQESQIILERVGRVRNIGKEIELNMRKVLISTPRTKISLSWKRNLITKVQNSQTEEVKSGKSELEMSKSKSKVEGNPKDDKSDKTFKTIKTNRTGISNNSGKSGKS
jgi:hypothetical protein